MARMFWSVKSRPSWYYRVQNLLADRYHRGEENLDDNDEPRPEDYEEDLSSVSTFSCASRNGCDYGTEDICEYHIKLDMEGPDSDKELDKNDPDDTQYLEMNMAQKELGPLKTYEEAAKEDDVGLTIRYIDEIRDALDGAQSLEETPAPLNLGLTRTFKLWSFDHIKHFPELTPTMYIKFSSRFDWGNINEEQIRTLRAEKLSGHIYLLWNAVFDLDDFTPLEYCSTKAHSLGISQEPVYIQFFNNNYLTLKIKCETLYMNFDLDDIPWNAPSSFTYYGISENSMADKEKLEEEEWETEEESDIE